MSDEFRKPVRLSELLSSSKALRLITAWKQCAGPALQSQAQFVGIKSLEDKLTLVLEIKDPLWRQELEFQKKEILKVYCRALEQVGVYRFDHPIEVLLLANEHSLFKAKSIHPQKGRVK